MVSVKKVAAKKSPVAKATKKVAAKKVRVSPLQIRTRCGGKTSTPADRRGVGVLLP